MDGTEQLIAPVHGCFRGVFLAPGEHIVEFSYRPRSFPQGLLGSGLGLVGLMGLVWLGRGARTTREQVHNSSSAGLLLAEPAAPPSVAPVRLGGQTWPAWTVLALVLVTGVPLFLCLPLWVDVQHYDLCVRNYLRGDVPYRDTFDNNLPGILWLQAIVRLIVGWRPEMLRLADLVIVGLAAGLLLRWVPRQGPARIWAAAVLAAFYLSIPERNHCQRDGWMLLPAVAVPGLRDLQMRRLAVGRSWFTLALLEGLCWGLAVWVKPFVVTVPLACWLATLLCRRRAERRR